MSEIKTVNEQLMSLSDVVAKRNEITAKLMEHGDTIDVEPKTQNIGRTVGVDEKIVANTNNELISAVGYQDKMKVRIICLHSNSKAFLTVTL